MYDTRDRGLLHARRTRKSSYVIRVTSVNQNETFENTGLPADNIWRGQQIEYGIFIKGMRMDYTNNPTVIALVPATAGGVVDFPSVGDFVMVRDDPNGGMPQMTGIVHSLSQLADVDTPQEEQEERNTWDNALNKFARPLPPSLDAPGNRGRVYTYNPIYLTYHEKYGDDRATNPDMGAWYDRFVLFDSSVVYRNKKSLVDYNPEWIEEGMGTADESWRRAVLNTIEDWKNPKKLEEYFYLKDGRFAYRPDPVFDVTSPEHQSAVSDPVVMDELGGSDLFGGAGVGQWDRYPMPLKLQDVDPVIEYTAYDEMINETLASVRRNAHNVANAELPLEAKEEHQIRIGRNKLVISDMHGDGKQVFVTLKTAADQQLSMLFNDGDEKTSQVRLRGFFGESLMLESTGVSKAEATGRMVFKGLNGQLVEVYDSAPDDNNYIYLLSSDGDELKEDYSLARGSYVLMTNNMIPSSSSRVTNTGVANVGRSISMGIFDGDESYEATQSMFWDGTQIAFKEYLEKDGDSYTRTAYRNSDFIAEDENWVGGSSTISTSENINLSTGTATSTGTVASPSKNVTWLHEATSTTGTFKVSNDDKSSYTFANKKAEIFAADEVLVKSNTLVNVKATKATVDSGNIILGGTQGGTNVAIVGAAVEVSGTVMSGTTTIGTITASGTVTSAAQSKVKIA